MSDSCIIGIFDLLGCFGFANSNKPYWMSYIGFGFSLLYPWEDGSNFWGNNCLLLHDIRK